MKQPFALNIKGLKCDAPGCEYRDDTIRAEQYETYLNTPCPKCGASLLTAEDLAAVKMLMAVAEWGNAIAGPVEDEAKTVRAEISFDGTGMFNIDFPGEPKSDIEEERR